MSILVITTGSTIGALPVENPQKPPAISTMPPKGEDLVRTALQTAFSTIATRCLSMEPRDSAHIDDSYRKEMVTLIEKAPEKAVLITHGTNTLLQTADFFMGNPALNEKVVILTGAMIPLANGEESDGHLNLAFSLDHLKNGVGLAKVNVVLCDFASDGRWSPRLYPHEPGRYEKFVDPDSRYSRLRLRGG